MASAKCSHMKDLLSAPPSPDGAPEAPALPDRARDRASAGRGAIGAVSRGIADLKARAVLDLDPFLISAGGVTDRLGDHHMHRPEGARFTPASKTITTRWPTGMRAEAEFVMPTKG